MGVSGIRKDPDALVCVESTPTPFRVVLDLENTGANMANNLIGVSAPVVFLPSAADQEAFALAGMALLDLINKGVLVVADQETGPDEDYATDLIGALYSLEDATHSGQSDALQRAVAQLCVLERGAL
jgi:hypothetical protein